MKTYFMPLRKKDLIKFSSQIRAEIPRALSRQMAKKNEGKMVDCIICTLETKEYVCICENCVKQQNEKRRNRFKS